MLTLSLGQDVLDASKLGQDAQRSARNHEAKKLNKTGNVQGCDENRHQRHGPYRILHQGAVCAGDDCFDLIHHCVAPAQS